MKPHAFRRSLALLLAVLLCLTLGGCGREKARRLRVDLSGRLDTLDPQMAEGILSGCILENCMEGLLRKLPDGTLTEGVTEQYESYRNGRSFRFFLREDACWSDGTPLTAEDFLFAFRRIFRGDAGPLAAERFSAVENSWEIYQGLLPEEELGVRVMDAHTLQIELGRSDPFFLDKLAEPAAFPCNEAYFESTHSRYGNSLDYVLFNGPYVLDEWSGKELRLQPNGQYHGAFSPQNAGVVCYLGREDPKGRFLNGETDFYEVDYATAQKLPTLTTTLLTFQNSMTELLFNRSEELPTGNLFLRRALCLAIDMPDFVETGRLPERYDYTMSLAPGAAQVFDRSYHELTRRGFRLGEVVYQSLDENGSPVEEPVYDFRYSNQLGYSFSPSDAKAALLDSGLDPAETALTLLLEEGSDLMEFAGWLQKQWHRHLGLIVNLEPVSPEELVRRVDREEYTLALVTYTAGSRLDTLFREILSGQAPFSYDSPRFRQVLDKAEKALNVQEAVRYFANAEAMLFDEAVAMPFFSGSSYFAMGEGVSGIAVSSDGHHIFFPGAAVE